MNNNTENTMKMKKKGVSWLLSIVMVIIYPIYLLIFKYTNFPIITLVLAILFSYGIMNIIKKGSTVIINEKGEEVYVRKRKIPYRFGEVIRKIVQLINKRKQL